MRCDNGMKIFLWSNVLFVIRWIPILACCTCWTRIPVGGTFAWSKLCSSLYELWRLCTPATTKRNSLFIQTPLKHNITQLYWHSSLKTSTIQWQDCILFRAIQNVTVGNVRYFALTEGAIFKFDWFFRISITFLTR